MPGAVNPLAAILAIVRKDLKVLARDRTALIFTFAFPLIFVALFGVMFRGQGEGKKTIVKILVANQDAGKQGAALVDSIEKVGLAVDSDTGGSADVTARVAKGEHAVGVVIPPDFSSRVEKFVSDSVGGGSASPVPARLMVALDPAQSEVGNIARGAIAGATQRVTGQLFAQYFGQPAGADNGPAPIALDVSEASAPQSVAQKTQRSAGDLIIPGFMVYFVFFLANGVAVALIGERQEGTLRRMLSAPITRSQILTGKLLARGILGAVQVFMLFEIGRIWLGMNSTGSPIAIALIAATTIFAAMGLGLMIATLGRTMEQIQGMTTLLLFVMGALSGTMVPRALLPESVQKLGLITPHAWALNAYQDVILRGLPLTATLVNVGVVLLFGIAFFGLALARFRYE